MYLVNFPALAGLDATFLAISRIRSGEIPIGAIDGVNHVYHTVAKFVHNLPFLTVEVFYNGVRMTLLDDYTISESGGIGTGYDTIALAFTPLSGDHVVANYVSA